ncbi:MAG: ABC transporter ATP-binding protein [bacterium]|nr:ABC transporter ATP-binding protein [bacterium]
MPFINIKNIRFSYGEEKILDNIDMDIERGDFVCLLGQSGCGKSTFLRLLAGLAAPNAGSIVIDGEAVTGASLNRGVVFQDYSLFPWFTAGKNIVLSMQQKFRYMTKQELKERAMLFLKRVGLDESVYSKYPNELSGGMRQRCAICRSFALDPPILLMDEPFGALDAVTRAHLQNLILSLWNQDCGTRKTIFFVTHDVEEALYLATKIYVFGLKPSRVIYSCVLNKARFDTREQLLNDPQISSLRQQLVSILNNDIETKLN